MLPDLATHLSTTLATASLVFFVVVYAVVSIGVFRKGADELDAHAHLALDDGINTTSRIERPGRG